jgi:hypothetical protein
MERIVVTIEGLEASQQVLHRAVAGARPRVVGRPIVAVPAEVHHEV